MTCEDVALDLDAYVDRELDAEPARAVREHLSLCRACRARVAERQELERMVRAAQYYPAPDRLRARATAGALRSASRRRLVTWAAAAVLVMSVGSGIALMRPRVPSPRAAVADVVDAHVRSLMAEHLFDVRSTDQHTVKPWFLGKLDFSPPVVDLASIGFPLVGGRLEVLDGRPTAALVYQRQKHTINVFISPDPDGGSGGPDAYSLRGFHVRRWKRDAMAYWAVSDLNDADLAEFVRALGAPK